MGQADPAHPLRAPLAGVIFDMDGVLVESEPFIAEAAIRMFAEKGAAVRAEDFRPFIGMGEDRFLGGVAEATRKIGAEVGGTGPGGRDGVVVPRGPA